MSLAWNALETADAPNADETKAFEAFGADAEAEGFGELPEMPLPAPLPGDAQMGAAEMVGIMILSLYIYIGIV